MTSTTKRRARVQAKPERTHDAPRTPLVGLFDWRASNPHLFPSDVSLRWHLRRFRDRYIAAGTLLEIAGRLVVDPQKFESVLREVSARAAAERETEPEAA
jgi:hypothetical protein